MTGLAVDPLFDLFHLSKCASCPSLQADTVLRLRHDARGLEVSGGNLVDEVIEVLVSLNCVVYKDFPCELWIKMIELGHFQ